MAKGFPASSGGGVFEIGDLKKSAAIAELSDSWRVANGSSVAAANFPTLRDKLNNSTALQDITLGVLSVTADDEAEVDHAFESGLANDLAVTKLIGVPFGVSAAWQGSTRYHTYGTFNYKTGVIGTSAGSTQTTSGYDWADNLSCSPITGEYGGIYRHSRADASTTSSGGVTFYSHTTGAVTGSMSLTQMENNPSVRGGFTTYNYDYEDGKIWICMWTDENDNEFNSPMLGFLDTNNGSGGVIDEINNNQYDEVLQTGSGTRSYRSSGVQVIRIPSTDDYLAVGGRGWIRFTYTTTATEVASGTFNSSEAATQIYSSSAAWYDADTNTIEQYYDSNAGPDYRRTFDVATNTWSITAVTQLGFDEYTGYDSWETDDRRYRFLAADTNGDYIVAYDRDVDAPATAAAHFDGLSLTNARAFYVNSLALDIDKAQLVTGQNQFSVSSVDSSTRRQVVFPTSNDVKFVSYIESTTPSTIDVQFGTMPASGGGSTYSFNTVSLQKPDGIDILTDYSADRCEYYSAVGQGSKSITNEESLMSYYRSSDGREMIIIPYQHSVSGYHMVAYLSLDGGSTWSTPQVLTSTNNGVSSSNYVYLLNPAAQTIAFNYAGIQGSIGSRVLTNHIITNINYDGSSIGLPNEPGYHIKVSE